MLIKYFCNAEKLIGYILGQQLYSSSFNHQKQITIDVAALPAGVYIVETDDKENRVLKKFVKQ